MGYFNFGPIILDRISMTSETRERSSDRTSVASEFQLFPGKSGRGPYFALLSQRPTNFRFELIQSVPR